MKCSGNISISIIIPFYNSDAYIGDVLENLLHQDISADEYEIIVVDDGSTENIDILRSYCANYPIIRYILIKHAGPSTARNIGLNAANGEYVFFCNSCDKVKRNVLGRIYEVATRNALEVLFFNNISLQENDNLPYSLINKKLDSPILSGDAYFACHSSMCIGERSYISKREFLINENLNFPKDVFMVEDRIFMISLMLAASRVSHIDTDAYYFIQRVCCHALETNQICLGKEIADCRLQYIQYMSRVLNDQVLLCRESNLFIGLSCEDVLR